MESSSIDTEEKSSEKPEFADLKDK
jgi:hypothetical protein